MSRNILQELRARVPGEIFDYALLMGVLSDYSNPRKRVTAMLRDGDIVRVKKGLYIFGDRYRRRLVDRYELANLIYGPSYASCESALSYHGLIPERVEAVVSMTLKRSKEFSTPLGRFTYRYLSQQRYACGIDRHLGEGSFLLASPEKAICDLVAPLRDLTSEEQMSNYVYESLRLDPSYSWDRARLKRIIVTYRNPRMHLLEAL